MLKKVMQRQFNLFSAKPGSRWLPLLHCLSEGQ